MSKTAIVQEQGYIRRFEELSNDDVAVVGGKNASLGEMIGALKEAGVRVPDGFATTADAYRDFLEANELEEPLRQALARFHDGEQSLSETGAAIRKHIQGGTVPEALAKAIREAYQTLSAAYDADAIDVAARSSATAEDLPEASFAGQQETYLNVRGAEALLAACKKCYASLFTDRAISYREEQGFDHMDVALSVGVQKMVRSDKAGVLFTIDTETGFPDAALINAAWGLGENVVKGTINPDQYTVYKPFLKDESLVPIIGRRRGAKEQKMVYAEGEAATKNVETTEAERAAYVLSDDEVLQLARWGAIIEKHYERPMDIEWARDGETEELFIVQARPETVQSQMVEGQLQHYRLKETGKRLVTGLSIGRAIATGEVCVIHSAEQIDQFQEGAILVTEMTDPDWGPILKKAAGVITDHGGRTSHAAIVSREMGMPAIVGTGNATEVLRNGQEITLSCAEGEEGYVYAGRLAFESEDVDLDDLPQTKTRIMMNIASPMAAMQWWRLPTQGVGLARMEYIVNNVIKIHPMALVHYHTLEDEEAKARIAGLTRGYEDKTEYFVHHLAEGIATIAATQYPEPVIVRTSDFKTNEYADLIGGQAFEPDEENPMLGWRGASRYYSDAYRDGFALECKAIRRVRETMGFDNVIVMIPFCRTPEEADRVLEVMAENGLERGKRGLEVYVMAEIPSNIIQAEDFARRFDGFSVGSNDLTQLVLGVGRDAERLSYLFDERNQSVKKMITDLIHRAHVADRPVGICGQAPSDHPEFAAFLVQACIDSISVIPDTVVDVIRRVAEAENALQHGEGT
ncbi:MAG: phosphoenolpyruvate synthase [Bacteroidetes bacterium]|jgi:pyruvate,water dikinase|nr:phosphoenolpyruvate synthase [Bacteroidota bacterium]